MASETKNYFEILNAVDVNDKTEKKKDLTYLSWAWAWGELKKKHPDANYTVYENADGWNYHHDGKTAWVKVGVTVNSLEHIEFLPVMDFRNKSIPLGQITSFEVNKTIQRALTKAIARHGLGLYIYAGEDLPEESDGNPASQTPKSSSKSKEFKCCDCGKPFVDTVGNDGKQYTAEQIYNISAKRNSDGKARCGECMNKNK